MSVGEKRWLPSATSFKLISLAESLDPHHFDHWGLVHDNCNGIVCPDCEGIVCMEPEDEDHEV